MNFKEGQPIYIQIADRLCDEVMAGVYPAESRVPGVREYSALLGVNVNTVVKSFELLARRGVIAARRGLGYFVTPKAKELITDARRRSFYEHMMPELIKQMLELGITPADIAAAWEAYTADTSQNEQTAQASDPSEPAT